MLISVDNNYSLTVYYTITLSSIGILGTIINLNHVGILSDLFNDKEQGMVVAFSQIVVVISSIFALVIPQIISNGWKDLEIVGRVTIFIAVPTMAFTLWGAYNYSDFSKKKEKKVVSNPFQSIILSMSIEGFRKICTACAFSTLGTSILSVSQQISMKYVLEINKPIMLYSIELSAVTQNIILQVSPTVIAIITMPIIGSLIPKYGKDKIWLLGTVFSFLYTAASFLARDFYFGLIASLFMAPALGVFLLIPDMIITASITEYENHPKYPGKGGVLGTAFFSLSIITMLTGPLQSIILYMTGFVQPTKEDPNPVQTDITKLGIWFLGGFLPSFFYYLSYIMIPKEEKKKNE